MMQLLQHCATTTKFPNPLLLPPLQTAQCRNKGLQNKVDITKKIAWIQSHHLHLQ